MKNNAKLKNIIAQLSWVLFLLAVPNLCNVFAQEKSSVLDALRTTDSNLSADTDKLVKGLIFKGSSFQAQGNHAEALVEFNEALRFDSSAQLYFIIAKSYFALNKYDQTISSLIKSISADSNFIPALDLSMEVFINKYDIKKALLTAEKLYSLEPTRERLFTWARLTEYDDIDKAISLYEKLAESNSDPLIIKRLNDLYKQNNQYEDYLSGLKRLYEYNPENTETIIDIIQIYLTNKDYSNAVDFLGITKSKLYNSELSESLYIIGKALFDDTYYNNDQVISQYLGQLDNNFASEAAITYIAGALALRIDSLSLSKKFFNEFVTPRDTIAEVYLQIGFEYIRYKKLDYAAEFLTDASSRFPDDVRFPLYLSNVYLLSGDYEKSYATALPAFTKDSSNIELLVQICTYYEYKKEYSKALDLYDYAMTISPENALVNNNYAYLLARNNTELDRASTLVNRALEIDPNNSAFLDTFAWVLYRQGNYNKALEIILQAIKNNDVGAEVFDHLGDIYRELNRFSDAKEAWEHALKLDPAIGGVIDKIKTINDK